MDPAMLDEVRNVPASSLAPAPLSTKPYLCDALLGARRSTPAANQPPHHPVHTPPAFPADALSLDDALSGRPDHLR